MYGTQQKKDPLSDPRIAALMASVESKTEKEASDFKKKDIKHPAETFEDFLLDEKIDEWPQKLTSEGTLDLSEINMKAWTEEELLKTLKEKASLNINLLTDVEDHIDEYSKKLEAFAGYIVSNEELPSRFKQNLFHAPKKEFLDKAAESDGVLLHYSRKKAVDAKQSIAEEMQALRSKNIDYASFPGYRDGELTELPSQLEAPQLLNKISQAQNFNKGFSQFWKKIFLSEATVALLQDTFWWFFLENFENNTHAQDLLYTRIASNYVTLFISVNPDIRDKVLQVFLRCFAQCVYLTFREAFSESYDRLAEQFVTDVYTTISEWMTGVKPPVDEWKQWPWDKMCSPPTEMISPTLPRKESAKSQGRRAADYIRDLQLDLAAAIPPGTADSYAATEGLPEIVFAPPDDEKRTPIESERSHRQGNNTLHLSKSVRTATTPGSPPTKTQPRTSFLGANSAQTGPGPDFERVMFNLAGRSPLVAHYLYMRQLRDNTSVGKKMRRTEIMQYPPPAPTFQDVIRHSRKIIDHLQIQRDRMMTITEEERIRQEKVRRLIAEETRRLQSELTDPVEIKMRCDKVLDQALGGGLHRPSSYATVRSTAGDIDFLLQEDVDCLPDPNSVI